MHKGGGPKREDEVHALPAKNNQMLNHLILFKKWKFPRMPQWTKNLLIPWVKCICGWHSHINEVWWFYFMSRTLKILRHRAQRSPRQEVACAFTHVRHFPLRINIILIKSSLLHVSVVKKKNTTHYPSFTSISEVFMTLAVKIFNKLDLKGHAPRYTEMKLTFALVPGNLTKNLLTYYHPQSDRMKILVISTILPI